MQSQTWRAPRGVWLVADRIFPGWRGQDCFSGRSWHAEYILAGALGLGVGIAAHALVVASKRIWPNKLSQLDKAIEHPFAPGFLKFNLKLVAFDLFHRAIAELLVKDALAYRDIGARFRGEACRA